MWYNKRYGAALPAGSHRNNGLPPLSPMCTFTTDRSTHSQTTRYVSFFYLLSPFVPSPGGKTDLSLYSNS